MENNQNQENQVQLKKPVLTQEQMMAEIYEFTKMTHRYLKWQIYITVVMVVLPILAMAFVLPMALSNLANSYGSLLK